MVVVRKHLAERRLSALLLASLLVPLALFIGQGVQTYSEVEAAVAERLSRRTAVMAEHVARVLDGQKLIIDVIEAEIRGLEPAAVTNSPRVARLLTNLQIEHPVTAAVAIFAPDGEVLLSAPQGLPGNHANRSYFRDAPTVPGFSISAQFVGELTLQPVFIMARREHSGMVIAVGLRSRYFEETFATSAGEDLADGVVTLYRDDGAHLARTPKSDALADLGAGSPGLMRVKHLAPEGVYQIAPADRGDNRLYAYRKVDGYPLWVTNGIGTTAIFAHWSQDMGAQALLTVSGALLLAAVSLWVARRHRQLVEAEARLEQVVAERTAEAERRAAEAEEAMAQRSQALRAAELANQAKSHFLASASHDLRQPIQGLRLFLDVLDQRLEGGEEARILAMADKALEGAEHLLSTLLDVSALEAGVIKAAPHRVSLGAILAGLSQEFAPQAQAKGLDFRAPPTSLWVETDPVLLARLLRNLLTNALRYTETGKVLLGCRRAGDEVRIEVWDSGRGIPQDKLETVFEDFVQLGNPERDRAKGLGLGLPVARRMAGLLGHPLQVRSQEGRGTVFWLCLPRVEPDLEGDARGMLRLSA